MGFYLRFLVLGYGRWLLRRVGWWLLSMSIALACVAVSVNAAHAAAGRFQGTSVLTGATYDIAVPSNSCADVMAAWDAWAQNASYNAVSCSSDPVVVGTIITRVTGAIEVTGITATASGGTTPPPATGDPVLSGMPTAIGPVDHASFAYGVMAICFAIGFSIGVRL